MMTYLRNHTLSRPEPGLRTYDQLNNIAAQLPTQVWCSEAHIIYS